MTLLGSMKAPDAKAVRSFASSAWAAFFVPRTVMKRVSRRPVSGSRPVSNFSRDTPLGWAKSAIPIWRDAYEDLSEGKPGLTGAVTSRAEAQTLRLALIYALLDGADDIHDVHLNAGLAVWRYCEQSVAVIFGTSIGDPLADEIHRMLKASPDGLTRAGIYDMLGRNRSRDEIGQALAALLRAGVARFESRPTKGRPEERWFACE